MSKIESRLEKLESQVRSMAQHYLWLDTGEDGDAKIADLIASGLVSTQPNWWHLHPT